MKLRVGDKVKIVDCFDHGSWYFDCIGSIHIIKEIDFNDLWVIDVIDRSVGCVYAIDVELYERNHISDMKEEIQ